MRRFSAAPPVPPVDLPPARTVVVPGRGEFFLRDGGADGDGRAPVLLLHGWTVDSDLNWHVAYGPLADAGYRVLAMDHRGHGRGPRPPERFRLRDCAGDAAAVLRALDTGPVTVVGYSMGGLIAQLLARDTRELVGGLVMGGTCQHFSDRETMRVWRWLRPIGVIMGLAPRPFYASGLRRNGLALDARATWALGELRRNEALEVIEAGRELSRFDSRPWATQLRGIPAAMVVTTADSAVSAPKQRELAEAVGASVHEVPLDHLELVVRPDVFVPALLAAIRSVQPA